MGELEAIVWVVVIVVVLVCIGLTANDINHIKWGDPK